MNAPTPQADSSGSVTLTLKYPVKVLGANYGQIIFRRPKVKDTRLLRDEAADGIDANNRFLAQLAGIPPAVFDELDLADMNHVQKVIEGFTKDAEK